MKKKGQYTVHIVVLIVAAVVICLMYMSDKHKKSGDTSTEGRVETQTLNAEESVISTLVPNTEITLDIPMANTEEVLDEEITVLYLTDFHAIVYDGTESKQVLDSASPRYAEFCDDSGKSSAAALKEWIDYANQTDVDAVLLGGDIIDFPSAANLAYLEEMVASLTCPYLFTLGNHDWTYPWEYMTDYAKSTYRPMFESLMGGNYSSSSIELNGIRFLSLDNSAGTYSENYENVRSDLEGEKPVIVLQHIPLSSPTLDVKAEEVWGSTVTIGKPSEYIDNNTALFLQSFYSEKSPVRAVLSGHVHFGWEEELPNTKIRHITGACGYEGNAVLIHINQSRS